MATYNKGHKRKDNEKFVSYVLIGFAVSFFAIVISLILFDAFDDTLAYDSFDRVKNFSDIQTYEEQEYLVYYYTETCPACVDVKMDILEFADSNNAGVKVYFLDAANVNGTNELDYMTGTPSLLTIVNGIIVDFTSGSISIPARLDAINDGSYIYIN